MCQKSDSERTGEAGSQDYCERAACTTVASQTANPEPCETSSTIGDALKRAGLVRGRKRISLREPEPSAHRRRQRTIDYKGQFRTGDGVLCYPLTVVDGYSRFLLNCTAHVGTSYAEARRGLERLCHEGYAQTTVRRSPPSAPDA